LEDLDVFALKSFDELRQFPMVLAQEGSDGLSSAFIVAHTSSSFLRQWFQEFRHFNELSWNWFSIKIPKILSREMSDSICVLNETAVCDPLYVEEGLRELFKEDKGRNFYTGHFAVHFWHSAFQHAFKLDWLNLTVKDIYSGNGLFYRLLRDFIDEFGERKHLEHIEQHGAVQK